MKSLMIAWVGYQRRADAMQDYWGYRLCHFPNRFSSKYLRVFDYFWKFVLSLGELLRMRPDVVWIQVPPSMLLHLAFFYKLIAFLYLNGCLIGLMLCLLIMQLFMMN
jgi:hypothetical protein